MSVQRRMGSAYLEALNPGLLRRRESQGEVRDPALLRETARLNRCLRRESMSSEPVSIAPPSAATTIPPPHWNRSTRPTGRGSMGEAG
jgi:hypothetical protein